METYIDMWKTKEVEGYDLYCEDIENPFYECYENTTKEQVFEKIKELAKRFDVKECEVHIEVEFTEDGKSLGAKTFDGYIDGEYELMHEDRLLQIGTKVMMYDGEVGIIGGNDLDSSDIFSNINYYVYPIDDDANYEMWLIGDIKLAE